MSRQSAVEFAGESRVHIGLNVSDLEASRAFYQVLLNAEPSKVRPGYVKFEPEAPSVNLTLNQMADPGKVSQHGGHYGVQVQSTDAVEQAIERFSASGLATRVQESTTCCYAVQDKVWVHDPDGNEWEVFVVLEADAAEHQDESQCCAAEAAAGKVEACC